MSDIVAPHTRHANAPWITDPDGERCADWDVDALLGHLLMQWPGSYGAAVTAEATRRDLSLADARRVAARRGEILDALAVEAVDRRYSRSVVVDEVTGATMLVPVGWELPYNWRTA